MLQIIVDKSFVVCAMIEIKLKVDTISAKLHWNVSSGRTACVSQCLDIDLRAVAKLELVWEHTQTD